MFARLVVALCLAALPVRADEIARSPLPPRNPAYLPAIPSPGIEGDAGLPLAADPSRPTAAAPTPRPRARPAALATTAVVAAPAPAAGAADMTSLRPKPRPAGLATASAPTAAASEATPKEKKGKKKKEKTSARGSVCGVNTVKGEKIAAIPAKVKGCGLKNGVRVTSVSGVRISPAITVDCATATALDRWIGGAVQPAYGGKVVEVRIAAHYICRTRNNRKGAKISEHGRGKAVDIAGFVLSNGKTVSVLGNYDKTLRKVHKQACGPFGTTLGPGSDGFHEDHLHLDTAAHRSGSYCR
ncbi:MAG: extensin family protein [Rhodobacteraceae bacterium]|nr:extensin family protein [Paracoccaceae bacterium]